MKPPIAATERSPRLLALVHAWLQRTGTESLERLVTELAEVFEAPAAGLVAPGRGAPVIHVRRGNSTQWGHVPPVGATTPPTVVEHRTADGAFATVGLNPQVGTPLVLWLAAGPAGGWTHSEKAALELAALALTRRVDSDGLQPEWQARFERLDRQRRLDGVAPGIRRMAHEFGNLLTSIQGYAELALSLAPAASVLHRYLGEVLRSSEIGAQLTHRLRLFARRPGRECMAASVSNAIDWELGSRETAARIQISRHVPDNLPAVAMPAEELRIALGCILENACEALGDAGRVSVTARLTSLTLAQCHELWGSPRPGDVVEVAIADSGNGIDPQMETTLFADLFQTTKPRHRGLGLPIVCRIAQAWQGGFRLEPAPGGGTIARLFLPCDVSGSASPGAASATACTRTARLVSAGG